MSEPGSGGGSGGRYEPGSTFGAGARSERGGDFGTASEDERYSGLPGEREEYEYEPFFASSAGSGDEGMGGPTERGMSTPDDPAERGVQGPAGGPGPSLPHWTEPPSGEHPRILADAEADADADPDDDLKAWSTLSTGPRWRDQPTDWDDADFGGAAVLDDPEMRLGALRTEAPDEDQDFGVAEPAVLPEAAPAPRARTPRGPSPVPGAPLPPGVPPAARRPRRLAPSGRSGPGAGRRREGLRPGVGDPGPPAGAAGGGLSNMRGRELQLRVVTGAVVLAVVLVAAALGPGALAFVVAVVLTMATAELYQAVRTHGYHPATLLGLAATAALVAVAYLRPGDASAYLLVAVLLVIFSFLWFLAGVSRARPIANIGITLMGFMYIGFLGSFAAVLLTFPLDHGIGLLLGAILATAAYDTGAYFVGAWTGRTPLMPHISPGKTVEGLVGGTFATLVMCILLVRAIHPWDGGRAFWLFVVVSVAAPLGDLCESMIKRELGVKDMGAIVPGHGGVLDRIDALLFVIPATFYLTQVLNFA